MPETVMEWLQFLAGPAIGALIGYFTNWIAVKMLFRPRKALYIGKWHVPFTPGVIPRRQGALGKALGKMISEMLVRKEDLKESLCSESVSRTVAKTVLALPSVREVGLQMVSEERYEQGRDKVLDFMTDRILQGILSLDLGEIITKEATATVNTFTSSNPLLKMFVSDQLIATLTAPIAEKVEGFLNEEGREKLREALGEQVAPYEERPIAELISDTARMENILVNFYRTLVKRYADAVVDHIHLERITENKINAMDPRELEELLLMVMKKELNAIVWLGVPIGFLMGCVTMLVNLL
jgi:uncharacterized membrane protein YheB (UPF0754 family)